jgi:hypothetical protein
VARLARLLEQPAAGHRGLGTARQRIPHDVCLLRARRGTARANRSRQSEKRDNPCMRKHHSHRHSGHSAGVRFSERRTFD